MLTKGTGTKVRKDILIHSSVGAIFLVAILHAIHHHLHTHTHWTLSRLNLNHIASLATRPTWEDDDPSTPRRLLVPSYIHYLLLDEDSANVTFAHFLCILGALKHQSPEAIFFHVGGEVESPHGPYWERLSRMTAFRRVARVLPVVVPEAIEEMPLAEPIRLFYAIGILRVLVVRQHGGIYLDTNMFTARNLSQFRAAPVTLDSGHGMSCGSQIFLADKDAPFLKVWSKLYRRVYESSGWYFWSRNPIDVILGHHPELADRLPDTGELTLDGGNESHSEWLPVSAPTKASLWSSYHVLRLPRNLQEPEKQVLEVASGAAPPAFAFRISEEMVRQYSMPLCQMFEDVAKYAAQDTG